MSKENEVSSVTYPVQLPSNGLLYEDDVLRKGLLHVRPMTVSEEELLGAQKESDRVKILDTIIQRLLVEKIPYDKLLVTDKLFLLFAIRRHSYGDDYKMKVKCDNCQTQFNHNVKFFDSFKIRMLTEEDNKEPYKTEPMPVSGSVITFRMLRVSDEEDIIRYTKSQNLKNMANAGDPGYSYRLAKHIVEINGTAVQSTSEALKFVKALVGRDSAAFKDAIEAKDSGVNIELEIECPSCGTAMERLFAFSAEFFRPSRT